jgi:uncharacterized protein
VKAVLDTNVVVSALLTAHGTCSQILDLLVDGAFAVCADDRILDEYDTVLRRPALAFAPDEVSRLLELIRSTAETGSSAPLPVRLPDPEDLPFLEVAAACGAVLVTGNERHYPRNARAGVIVLSPRDFLELIRRAASPDPS